MRRDLYKVMELFRKSFSGVLNAGEQEELEEILRDDSLRGVYEQLSDEEFIEDKFREFEGYDYKPAFGKLKQYRRRSSVRRWTMWSASAVAVLALCCILFLSGEEKMEGKNVPIAAEHVIPAGSKSAVLKLADGRVVKIGQESMSIRETGGSVVTYEGGLLSYSSDSIVPKELFNELEVPVGGECFVRLDDGTEVWLNAGSKLKYPVAFSGEERRVIFSGEAFFEVKKDSHPFIVSMETGEVTVLGTSFGVSAYPGETDYTTLVSGKVCFQSKGNKKVILSPGEQAVLHPSGKLEKREVDVEEYVGWKDGVFVFKEKTLSEIMKILERWYGVNVIFQDESLKELEYTGNLERYDSINTFLQLLERLKEIRYEIKENTIVLFR